MERYALEKCSLYTYLQIQNKDIYIFDSHNMALPIWGTYSSKLQTELSLVTFDSHADTRLPFAAEVLSRFDEYCISSKDYVLSEILKDKKCDKNDFSFDDVFKIAYQYVKNDEHILTANYLGYIKAYNVICDLDHFEAQSYEKDDCVIGYDAKYYVREQQFEIDYREVNLPLILDFDLDFFIHDGCINDDFKKLITPFVENASIITIAREPEYFNSCKIQNNYTCEKALEDLLMMIEQILNDKAKI